MSRMHYQRECYHEDSKSWEKDVGKGVQLIEPLWGYLKDPFDKYCALLNGSLSDWINHYGESKEHIMTHGFAPYAYTLTKGEIPEDQWQTHGIPPWTGYVAPSKDLTTTYY